ncbi:MAG: hypothetical protein COV07_01830 [Candidatus Vogelbacteria bacterium CG10_big_fil_rev_8_21_14_0_10_45_14]|uniref:Glycosyltransferase family 1 protein n=1 Tax=Candidatus Vogelbacteria bacterium CG10_big_fil_rev_8_21_14_0_10_45_14 TaxID=1975042 RepID=A0A2H0RKB4_9BACT|nr:MAG: hypothetical protein COV07_01830 [Candidatus Vogelbacteria bacterium CG10_big_fil_rev_8_21_14_0_10_45_14]
MKILYLITKSNWGGAQKYVFNLGTAMKEKGHDVAVAYGGGGYLGIDSPGRLESALKEASVRGIYLPELSREVGILRELRATLSIYKLLRQEKPDVLHLSSSKTGGVGAFSARLARVPRIIFTSHGLAFDERRALPVWVLMWLATWATFLLCDIVILISKETRERASRLPFCREKTRQIYNGIHAPHFLDKGDARKKLERLSGQKFDSDTLFVGSIGELTKNKDHLSMIEAIALLPPEIKIAYFAIGDGEERETLMRAILDKALEKRYFLLGEVEDAANLLSGLDIFTLTSQKEGLPYVLMEAGYARLPVIASSISGNTDIVEDGVTGLLTNRNDCGDIRNALIEMVANKGLRERLAEALQSKVQKIFSIHRMMEETEKIYTSR